MPTTTAHPPSRSRRPGATAHRLAAGLSCVLVAALTPVGAAASPRTVDDPAVIAEWNAIALTTLAGDTTKAPMYGETAAATLIAQRADDGRNAISTRPCATRRRCADWTSWTAPGCSRRST